MSRSLTWSMAGLAGASVLLSAPAAPVLDAAQSRGRVVHATVLDKAGWPVRDMTAADFEVKEGGRAQKILSVKPAMTPMRIALIVSDGGSGAFQLGVANFIQDLISSDQAEFAIYSVLVQPEKYLDYTKDPSILNRAIERLGVRGRAPPGAQLMEAIMDAAKTVRGEADRSAIVVARVGREGSNTMRADSVRKELVKYGTKLYVVSTAGAQRAAPSQVQGTDNISVQRGQLADAENADAA